MVITAAADVTSAVVIITRGQIQEAQPLKGNEGAKKEKMKYRKLWWCHRTQAEGVPQHQIYKNVKEDEIKSHQ